MTIGEEIYNKMFAVSHDKSYSNRVTIYKSDCVDIINSFLLDLQIKNSTLEAKITAYEAILNNSNFAMAVIKKSLDEPPTDHETVTDNCPFTDKTNCAYYPNGCGKCACNNEV